MIIDRKYVDNVRFKDGKRYNEHRKYYKYKCLNCNNEDWVIEYTLNDSQHCGCNACCYPPKKLVQGINDIATTNPWMIKYFDNPDDANDINIPVTKLVTVFAINIGIYTIVKF